MNRRRFVVLALASIAGWPAARAQTRTARIGFLWTSIEHRIPAVYTTSSFIAAGGFMAYGTNFEDLYRRSARSA